MYVISIILSNDAVKKRIVMAFFCIRVNRCRSFQMFIVKDSGNRSQVLTEAEELKPSCEVHGGNLFVQLHFKAIKAVPDSAELINTVVTSRDES